MTNHADRLKRSRAWRADRFLLTDTEKTRLALAYQALHRLTNPAFTVWIDEGALYTRELYTGDRRRQPWMEVVAEMRAAQRNAA